MQRFLLFFKSFSLFIRHLFFSSSFFPSQITVFNLNWQTLMHQADVSLPQESNDSIQLQLFFSLTMEQEEVNISLAWQKKVYPERFELFFAHNLILFLHCSLILSSNNGALLCPDVMKTEIHNKINNKKSFSFHSVKEKLVITFYV